MAVVVLKYLGYLESEGGKHSSAIINAFPQISFCFQIFCKTVEFLPPKASPEDEGEPELTADDVKVFLVDPREERPSQRELELIYDEQVRKKGFPHDFN